MTKEEWERRQEARVRPLRFMFGSLTVFTLIVFGWVAWYISPAAQAAPNGAPFVYECKSTLKASVDFLNTLDGVQRQSIQLVAVPSSRNVGGWFGDPYCVVYQR
jgi:hypothetical protein